MSDLSQVTSGGTDSSGEQCCVYISYACLIADAHYSSPYALAYPLRRPAFYLYLLDKLRLNRPPSLVGSNHVDSFNLYNKSNT